MNSYDILKLLTVKLTASKFADKKSRTCSATGFYAIIDNVPVIVTAKHFAEDVEPSLTIPAHYKENDAIVTMPITATVNWKLSDEYDIAYCEVAPLRKKFKEITGRNMHYFAISEKDIMTKEEFSKINILSEVLSIGYPAGVSSTHHEFPLFKKGYISSMPRDFAEDNKGYLDLCADHGMSGAPIFLNDAPLKLLGILVQSVQYNSKSSQSTVIYVSADKILNMVKTIKC